MPASSFGRIPTIVSLTSFFLFIISTTCNYMSNSSSTLTFVRLSRKLILSVLLARSHTTISITKIALISATLSVHTSDPYVSTSTLSSKLSLLSYSFALPDVRKFQGPHTFLSQDTNTKHHANIGTFRSQSIDRIDFWF